MFKAIVRGSSPLRGTIYKFGFAAKKCGETFCGSTRRCISKGGACAQICLRRRLFLKKVVSLMFLFQKIWRPDFVRAVTPFKKKGVTSMKRYEEIPHTADVAIRAYGKDLRELFSNAAFGMFDIIADLSGLKKTVSMGVNLEAPSPEELLISWLDELLYSFYTKGIIFFEFDIVDITDTRISGHAHGRLVGENRSRLKTEIKAATYHDLKIEEKQDGYSVEIVFDV